MAGSEGSISLGPWGGDGGSPYSFKPASWIKKITIDEGLCIDAITFEDANGVKYGKFGGRAPNASVSNKIVEIDGPSEYLRSIAGTYGPFPNSRTTVITSLSFITNRTTYGPFGTTNGTSFSIPMEGSIVTGFHGRDGYYIDSIGIFVKPEK